MDEQAQNQHQTSGKAESQTMSSQTASYTTQDSPDNSSKIIAIANEEEKQLNNNQERRMPPAGFNKNPQNINRNGRPPKDWTWASLLEQAAEELQDVREGQQIVRKPWKKLLVRKLFIKAVKEGDVQAAKIIMDRTDGLPTQDLTSGGEKIDMSPKVIINTKDEKYVENS